MSKRDKNYYLYVQKAVRSLPLQSLHIPHYNKIPNVLKREYVDFMGMLRAGLFCISVLCEIQKDMDSIFNEIRFNYADLDRVSDSYRLGILVLNKYRKMI